MNLFILSIVDREGQQYGPLHVVKSLNIGQRFFMESMRNPQGDSMLVRYPESFALMCIGMFDDETGLLDGTDGPVLVMEATAALRIINTPPAQAYSEETLDLFQNNGEVVSNG